MKEKIVLSWSGGKDSAMALHALLESNVGEVVLRDVRYLADLVPSDQRIRKLA